MACLDLTGRSVLVVGGGPVALEKVEGLLACGAARDRRRAADRPRARPPRCRRSCGAATAARTSTGASSSSPRPSTTLGQPPGLPRRRGARAALQRRRRARAVHFILPAVHRAGPDRGRRLDRRRLAGARAAAARRDRRASCGRSTPSSRAGCASCGPGRRIALHDLREREGVLRAARRAEAPRMTGRHLVGAGPGDPGLITVRGLELAPLAATSLVVRPARRGRARRRGARRCARDLAAPGSTQEAVDRLLVALRRAGLDVVRLKGGDPFVFGRGGEEALALAEAGSRRSRSSRASRRSPPSRPRRGSRSRTAASPTASRSRAATPPTARSPTTRTRRGGRHARPLHGPRAARPRLPTG